MIFSSTAKMRMLGALVAASAFGVLRIPFNSQLLFLASGALAAIAYGLLTSREDLQSTHLYYYARHAESMLLSAFEGDRFSAMREEHHERYGNILGNVLAYLAGRGALSNQVASRAAAAWYGVASRDDITEALGAIALLRAELESELRHRGDW